MYIYKNLIENYPQLANKKIEALFSLISGDYSDCDKKVGLKQVDRNRKITICKRSNLTIDITYNPKKHYGRDYIKVFDVKIMCQDKQLHSFYVECKYVNWDIGSLEKIIQHTIDNNQEKIHHLIKYMFRLHEYCLNINALKPVTNSLLSTVDFVQYAEENYQDLITNKIIEFYDGFGGRYYRVNDRLCNFFDENVNIIKCCYDDFIKLQECQSIITYNSNKINEIKNGYLQLFHN